MKNQRLMLLNCFAALLLMLTIVCPVNSQDDAKQSLADQQIKVFQLQSASPEMVVNVIQTMLGSTKCRLAIDPRSNGIIAAGAAKQLAEIEALIVKLDQGQGKKSSIIHMRHVKAEDAAELLMQQFKNTQDLKIVADPRQNALFVSAQESVMQKIMSIVEAVDRAETKGKLVGKNVLVYTYWIVDEVQTLKQYPEWDLREVPESIEKLVKEKLAKRTTIKRPMLAAQVAIQASVGDSEKNSSKIQTSGGGKIDSQNAFEVQCIGKLWNEKESFDKVDIELLLEFGISVDGKSTGSARAETKIRTPLNHPVCLGMTPVNNVDSILVVELVDADQ